VDWRACGCHASRWCRMVHAEQVDGAGSDAVCRSSGPRWRLLAGHVGGLTRYRPARAPPRPPRITVLTDEESDGQAGPAQLTAGRRALFRWKVVDLKTRGETRRYRWQVAHAGAPIDGSRDAAGWQTSTRRTECEWTTNRPGNYTFALQYIDRDLNYSEPALHPVNVSPVWYANAWIMVPAVVAPGTCRLGLCCQAST
jgi:hypothetical protein